MDDRETTLHRLLEAANLLHQSLSLDALLARLVEVAAPLLGARYVALGVLGPDERTLSRFLTLGMTPEQEAAIGPLPTGKGLLGAMLTEGRALRVADLTKDPRSGGFPPGHPPMASFLGVPILWRGRVFGRLYCTEKQGAPEFTAEDEEIATLLAGQAAIALENADLYERAMAASRLKSEFLATMSHELRTPMNAILGFTELLETEALGPLEGPQREALGRVLRNGRHLLELIDDVLDLSKIEAGEAQALREPYAPRPLLEAALAAVAPQAQAKGLALSVQLTGLPAVASSDETKVRQIALNLLSNAVKFTEAGSVALNATAADGWLQVDVVDSGPGIAAEHQALIFEAFRQVDASRTRQAGGTGLGLAISRKLAELMGGTLSVVSAPGQGSAFTLRLPL